MNDKELMQKCVDDAMDIARDTILKRAMPSDDRRIDFVETIALELWRHRVGAGVLANNERGHDV